MKINERVDHLEGIVQKHLEESGEIRADLKWLKKFLWLVLSAPLATEAVKHLWK